MVAALTKIGMTPLYTEYNGEGHEVWGHVFRDSAVWRWLFRQRRGKPMAATPDSEDDGFLDWVLKNDPDAILKQTQDDGVTASEKYWLGFDSAIEVADVNLNFTRIGTYEEDAAVAAGGEPAAPVPTVSIAFTNNGEPITAIRGDGALVLLGKVSLDDPEWRYIQRLYPEDLNGERVLILSGTDCNVVRAVLLSVKDAEAKGRVTDVSRP